LELLHRLNPTIPDLTQAIKQEVEKCPARPALALLLEASRRFE
jgi:hypothetical protein